MQNASDDDKASLEKNRLFVVRLARLESIEFAGDDAPESATALVGNMKVLIPLAEHQAAMNNLQEQLAKIEKL